MLDRDFEMGSLAPPRTGFILKSPLRILWLFLQLILVMFSSVKMGFKNLTDWAKYIVGAWQTDSTGKFQKNMVNFFFLPQWSRFLFSSNTATKSWSIGVGSRKCWDSPKGLHSCEIFLPVLSTTGTLINCQSLGFKSQLSLFCRSCRYALLLESPQRRLR